MKCIYHRYTEAVFKVDEDGEVVKNAWEDCQETCLRANNATLTHA